MVLSSLGLDKALLHAVAEQGYAVSTPIQSQAIPAMLIAAQAGTGKTVAFALPLLQRLIDGAKRIFGRRPTACQNLLFPATISQEIRALADFKEDRVQVLVAPDYRRPRIEYSRTSARGRL